MNHMGDGCADTTVGRGGADYGSGESQVEAKSQENENHACYVIAQSV